MKKTLFAGIVAMIAAMLIVVLRTNTKKATEPTYPLFWTWLNYHPTSFDSICNVIAQAGFDGIILKASTAEEYKAAISVAHLHHLEVYAWVWSMNPGHEDRNRITNEHPEWLSVNRNGKNLAEENAYVDYYKFMCPALTEVRQYIKDKISSLCQIEGLNGISIDYHRFVDVILPTTLWPNYGVVQDKEYAQWDYGYHPEMIRLFMEKHGYNPLEQSDPSKDDLWLQFRCDQITEVANEIAEVVHAHGKVMAASPFPTPKMSRQMVRQDWGKWNLDIVFPMVYHNFYTEDVSFVADCTLENVCDKNPHTTLYCGLMVNNTDEVFDSMNAALSNGAEGVAIFTIDAIKSDTLRRQLKVYTDSVRAARQQPKTAIASQPTSSVVTDPFQKEGVMKAVTAKMQQQLAEHSDLNVEKVALELGDYQLQQEYGVTKQYKVIDHKSKEAFSVTFYFYGDILSGWNVTMGE